MVFSWASGNMDISNLPVSNNQTLKLSFFNIRKLVCTVCSLGASLRWDWIVTIDLLCIVLRQFGFSCYCLSSSGCRYRTSYLPPEVLKWSLCCHSAGMKNVYFVSVINCTFEFIILVGFLLCFEKNTLARVGCWVKCTPERLELKVVGLYSAI